MNRERLCSLDLLRGLDMFLLTVVGSFEYALNETIRLPEAVHRQFGHAWGGFTLWDLIMPLFIFMCGAAVPFGLGKRMRDGRPAGEYVRHVLARVALLWVLGMIAQGRLLTLDPLKISPFNNTLQAIACGYLIAALVYPIRRLWVRRLIPVLLAAGYALALHWGGDYSMDGNLAMRFERWFVTLLMPTGTQALVLADPGYTWWFTIPMFGAMTLCGMEATQILTSGDEMRLRFRRLAALGVVLLASGWILASVVPVIKHLYTISFTAQAMGWCCLLLAVLFCLTDILRFRRGLWIFILFGQTALLAYLTIDVFGVVPNSFAAMMTAGVAEHISPSAVQLTHWFFVTLFLVTVLVFRRAAGNKSGEGA